MDTEIIINWVSTCASLCGCFDCHLICYQSFRWVYLSTGKLTLTWTMSRFVKVHRVWIVDLDGLKQLSTCLLVSTIMVQWSDVATLFGDRQLSFQELIFYWSMIRCKLRWNEMDVWHVLTKLQQVQGRNICQRSWLPLDRQVWRCLDPSHYNKPFAIVGNVSRQKDDYII